MKTGRDSWAVFRMIFIRLFSFLMLLFRAGRTGTWNPVDHAAEEQRSRNRRQADCFTGFHALPTSTQTVLRLRRFPFKRFFRVRPGGSGKFASVPFDFGTDLIFLKKSLLLLRYGRCCSFMTLQCASASADHLFSVCPLRADYLSGFRPLDPGKQQSRSIWNSNKSLP